jgi:hypothetical protein
MIELAIQIHPMVPLAKASAILKINRDELIARLSSGELLGEKRRIGESKKDSWFIYADQFDRLISQAMEQYEERVSTKGLDQFFGPGSGLPESKPPTPVAVSAPTKASLPGQSDSTRVAETVAIEPIAVDQTHIDPAEIVDALGTNYALGSDYDLSDCDLSNYGAGAGSGPKTDPLASSYFLSTAASTAPGTNLQVGQAMVAQLMQHLQDERHSAEALQDRLTLLEDEVDQLRRELMGRPDSRSHSPLSRLTNYLRLLLGKST